MTLQEHFDAIMEEEEGMRQDEIRERIQEGKETRKDCLRKEFDQTYTDFELAELMVENKDEEMTFEDWVEIKFEEYCEHRDWK